MRGKYWKIFVIICVGILFRAIIVRSLYPIYYEREFLWFVTILLGIGNTVLIWLIGNRLFDEKVASLASFIYSISPWTAYLEAAGSIYILTLFCILLAFIAVWHFSKNFKFLIIVIAMIITPFLYRDFQRHNTIFSDIGLINTVNQFQGETKETNLIWVGRYIENRYIYFTQYLLFNFLKHLTPLTYFTPEVKLLDFSFSPPILLGFLIPFILGMTAWFKLWKRYKLVTLVPLLLLIPSVFSKQSPSLSKLVIFTPVIIFTISYGFITFFIKDKSGLNRVLLAITILLIIIQIIVVLFDIILREPVRLHG